MSDELFGDLKPKIEKQYETSLQNSLDYEKAFGRYLVVGSGAAIIFILSSYRSGENTLLATGKFDLPLWLFTISILLGALNVYISMTLASRYASTFLFLRGMMSKHEMKFFRDNPTIEEINVMMKEFGDEWKAISKTPKPFQLFLSGTRIVTALTFSSGLLLSIFYVTSYYD